ncbi:MAG: glycosyltransferase [Calditrichaeota bacterium]|nr:MAG: glycosyltransferase [Calditrichota bacterium]
MSEKIRVLQVVDGFRMGGAENKLWELVEHLDTNQFESFVANVGPSGPLADKFKSINVPVFDCSRKHRFDVAPIFKLKKIMREYKIDVVQNTLFWADMVGSIAARLAKVPVVISWETVTHEGNPYHAQLQRRFGYQIAMKYTDCVAAVSHEIKQSLQTRRNLPAEMIEVIHYGVDLEKFSPNGTTGEKRKELGFSENDVAIVIVARLEKVKGHRYFVEAFAKVAAKYPHASVIFVGDGAERTMLEKMVSEANLESQIRFMGIRRDVPQVLNAVDFFVLPSIAGEGLPNVVLEAMACRKPVVAADVGGTAEAVNDGKNGFIFPPKNIEKMAAALERLISDRHLLNEFSANSRQIAETDFSLGKEVNAFQQLYLKLLAQKKK